MCSVDDQMAYTAFARDHGPLNLAFTFSAFLAIHDKLSVSRGPSSSINLRQSPELKHRPICLYTNPEAKMKSNMVLMVALYYVSRNLRLVAMIIERFQLILTADSPK